MSSSQHYICRICMQSAPELQSVFEMLEDDFIAQIIFDCTAVQVVESDGLPEQICVVCLEELKKFHKFVQKARSSNLALKKLFQKRVEIKYEPSALEVANEEPQFAMVVADELILESSEDNGEDDFDLEVNYDQNLQNLQLEMFEIIEVDRAKLLCCACLNQFDHEHQLQEHLSENHSNDNGLDSSKKFLCKFCNCLYSSAITLRAHQSKMESLSTVFECETCKIRVYDPKKCIHHSKTHHQQTSEKAPRTEKAQPSLEELTERHGRICCALGCSEVFETETQLVSHAHAVHKISRVEITLAEEKPVECRICFKRFKDDECLQRHLRFKYQPSMSICTVCGAKFANLSSLAIHERSHTKEKPFKCEICGKAFGDKQSLKRHHVRHTNERPFMCSICGVAFKRKTALHSHMIIHKPGGLPFKCDYCEKRFGFKAKMQYHMRTHTGEKPYPCQYCEKSFADFSNRMRHEMAHRGEKPYKCPKCPLGFITRRALIDHETTHKWKEAKKRARAAYQK